MGKLRSTYVLSSIHLVICFFATLAYILPPKLQFLGILWVILNIVDFPISAVAISLAWRNGLLAAAWIVVIGTLWWYLLSVTAAFLRKKLRA